MYTALARRCTRFVHAVNDRVHGYIHGTYTAVHTGRKDGRVDGRVHGPCTRYTARARPCIRYVHGRVRAEYPAVFCHVPAAYTAVFGTRTDHVHGPCTAVYTVCTRPPTAVYRLYTAVLGLCTWSVRDRVHGRIYRRVDGRVYGPCTRPPTAMYRLCTRPCTGHVHGPSVTRSRPCTRPVPDRVRTLYMTVHGPCTVYTAVFTARVHGGVRTMYTAGHGP